VGIHKSDDGTYTISAGGVWQPGCYEDTRTANRAFRISNEDKAELQGAAIERGTGIVTWQDIKDKQIVK
jgi:hypothetical protein